MITGKANKQNQMPAMATARDVRFANGFMVVVLTDGRELSIPLKFYPTLVRATPAQRGGWDLIGDGTGIVWDDLARQLCVQYLLEGAREGIPKPPDIPELGPRSHSKPGRRSK